MLGILIVTQAENTPTTATVGINITQQNPILKLLTTQFEMNAKHRRNFVCDGGDVLPPLLKVVVTVTNTFSKWNLQFFKQF